MVLSLEQKVWVFKWYAASGSPKHVQIEFRKKFGRNAKAPSNVMIYRLWNEFNETGNVNDKLKKTKRPKWVRTELKEEEVLARFRNEPHLSTRSLAREEGMPSQTTVVKILKVNFI